MKFLYISLLFSMYTGILALDDEPLAQVTLSMPGLYKLIPVIHEEATQLREKINDAQITISDATIKTQVTIQDTTVKICHELDAINKSINSTTQMFAHKFDPQPIILCVCGLTCVWFGAKAFTQDSTKQQALGAGLTLFGVVLTLYSHVILDYINS